MTDPITFQSTKPTSLSFNHQGKEIFSFQADGSFELGPGWDGVDDAAKKLFECMFNYAGELFKTQADEIERLRLENERLRKMFGEMPAAWSDKINQTAKAALKQENRPALEWQPIKTYDAYKRKPKGPCIFWYAESVATRVNGTHLPAMVADARIQGRRECTHWAKIIPPKEQE